MKRAIFVKRMLLGLSSFFIPLNKPAKNRQVFLSSFYVAGFAYYDGNRALKRLRTDEQLLVRHEPENPFDHRALEIFTADGAKLGYVPRVDNPVPSRLLRQDIELAATVEKVYPEEANWKKVKVRLFMVV